MGPACSKPPYRGRERSACLRGGKEDGMKILESMVSAANEHQYIPGETVHNRAEALLLFVGAY